MAHDQQERLAADARSLTASARQHLASLHGLGPAYAASAVAQLPAGTTALLLAADALVPGPDGYAPDLSPYGLDLLAWLAATEPLVPSAPSPDQLRALYDRVVDGAAQAGAPADLRLADGASAAVAGQGLERPAAELRALEALTDRAIADVLADRGGVLHVEGAGSLVAEPAGDGVDVRDVSVERSGWSFLTADGADLGAEPTRVPVDADAPLPELARTILGRRRRA